MTMTEPNVVRCAWAADATPLMQSYHDLEWGKPLRDDRALFELLALEGFQAGLNWSVILRKREAFRETFEGFDPVRVAAFDGDRIAELMANSAIVRNRAKIEATIGNARAVPAVLGEFGSLANYLWHFVDGVPQVNLPASPQDVPPSSDRSDAMSRDLRSRGFRFVGSTICYAFMQAAGLVDDHLVTCFCSAASRANRR
jgi:DNA-3-methyladenine glycosylase I